MSKCTCPPMGPFSPLPDYNCPIHGGLATDGFTVTVLDRSAAIVTWRSDQPMSVEVVDGRGVQFTGPKE